MKLTEDLAKELISINSKIWGRLSCTAFAGKLAEKVIKFLVNLYGTGARH